MDKLTAIRTFVAVADQGSFSAAARKLGLSASTVTKMIARLEDSLGTRLVNRTTRKLALTQAGQAYYERCLRILTEISDAEAELTQTNTSARGTVRIVVPLLFGRQTLIPALPDFFREYPEVDLQLNFSDRPVDLIEAGYDLGVHTGDLSDSGLIRRVLIHGPQITAAAPAYLARHGTPHTPEDLHAHNCIHGRFGPDWTFRSPTGGRQRVRVSGNLIVYNGDCLREAAVQGLGIVHSTWWALRRELASGTLQQILKPYVVDGPSVAVVYPASRHLPQRVRVLIDFMAALAEAEQSGQGAKRARRHPPPSQRA